MNFRSDINGLRALAVAAVVLFHFRGVDLPGGFIGVDVFFVISGYLMTSIIVSKLDRGSFSLKGFYASRIRRIVPPLLVLCIVLMVAGWFLSTPIVYRQLGKHAFASLLFFSNAVYAKEVDYFDAASQGKWLLHTWSLSVEWQFYIVYPLLAMAIRRWVPRPFERWTYLALTVALFGASCVESVLSARTAYYLLPARAWELLAGGLVYLFPKRRTTDRLDGPLEVLGLFAIGLGACLLDERDRWPGGLALVPVLGTALIVHRNAFAGAFARWSVVQWIGSRSYSIYLWHWPFAVALYYLDRSTDLAWNAAFIALAVAAGGLSYRFVERSDGPWSRPVGRRAPWVAGGLVLASVLAASAGIVVKSGVPGRMTDEFNRTTAEMVFPSVKTGWCFYDIDSFSDLPLRPDGPDCGVGDTTSPVRGLLFGDSFAGQYEPFWDAIGKQTGVSLTSLSSNWCYPSLGDHFAEAGHARAEAQCRLNRRYFAEQIERYDFVVLAGSWGSVVDGQRMQEVFDVIDFALARHKRVIVMAAPRGFDKDPLFVFQNALLLHRRFEIGAIPIGKDGPVADGNARLAAYAAPRDGVQFIDRASLFNVDGLSGDVTADNRPYTFGTDHISVYGSKVSAHAFAGTAAFDRLEHRFEQLRSRRPPPTAAR